MRTSNRAFTVERINKYIYTLFENEPFLKNVTVEGEVSNLKYHNSGHIYFDLKDASGKISCVMYRGSRGGLSYQMSEGDAVYVTGSVTTYSRYGTYQLNAKFIEAKGAGELYELYEKLKKELEEMGMFDASYKKPIPKYAGHLGIVTAPKGAAVRDIIRIATRRNPHLRITLYPALVQGEGAASSVANGISVLDELGVDVMIVGRGGGSIEDLWAFNEEEVARAIFSCSTPIISAVGHETDTTIADFVADKRAATPSEAAELAVDELSRIYGQLEEYRKFLYDKMLHKIESLGQRADRYEDALKLRHPERKLESNRQRLSEKRLLLSNAINKKISDRKRDIAIYASWLDGASPAKKLAGGFSYIADENKKNIKSIKAVKENDRLLAFVTDGKISLTVDGVEEYE